MIDGCNTSVVDYLFIYKKINMIKNVPFGDLCICLAVSYTNIYLRKTLNQNLSITKEKL